MMESWTHILQRELLHIAWSPVTYLSAFFTMRWLYRRWPEHSRVIFPAVVAFAFIAPREACDVWNGGSLLKSVLDMTTWGAAMAGCAVLVKKYTRWEE